MEKYKKVKLDCTEVTKVGGKKEKKNKQTNMHISKDFFFQSDKQEKDQSI